MSIAEISELAGLITTGLGLIGMVIAYIKKVRKVIKEAKIKQLIEKTMADVEVLDVSGDIKKMKVLGKVVELYGEGADIYKFADNYIEECIEFSKKINNKK